MERRFEGKVVVITGAAGGIGKATAERFAQEGASVVCVDLAGSALDEVVAVVETAGSRAIAVPADVSKSADVERYVKAAKDRFGGIDAFFNNAGIEGWVGPTTQYPEDMFDKVIAVNLKGVFLGIKYVAPAMIERGGGAIVNTASTAGLSGTPSIIAYGASKHAVVGMTKSAALEFASRGIRTNAICPSPIETRMMRALERGINPDEPEQVHQQMASTNPMGRYGDPAEVAAFVAFLCSPDASYLNGGIFPIDGGRTAGRSTAYPLPADTYYVAASCPAIELCAAARSFGERQALQPLDLAIETGEIFGLLGPNGSGKTTTLRILATLIPPTSGSARVLGHDVVSDPMAVRRSIGVMPERPGLYERLTIRDNLVFWADAHGVDSATSVSRALEFVGLSERASERVGQLSKGWRQRVALARAVIHRPPVLLLDEPSSGLDPSAAAAMESMIRELVASGATVLMNTHRLAEAERICDRVAILRQGELLQLGTPRQLRNRLLGGVVRVELAAPPDTGLRAAASAWPFASSIEWGPSGFSARLADPSTHTPKLVAALVGAGADVLSVVQEGDLEAAYLKLMGGTPETQELETAA